jgi:hypothetical protein
MPKEIKKSFDYKLLLRFFTILFAFAIISIGFIFENSVFSAFLYNKKFWPVITIGLIIIPISLIFLYKYNLVRRKEFMLTLASYMIIISWALGWAYHNEILQFSIYIIYFSFSVSGLLLFISLYLSLRNR